MFNVSFANGSQIAVQEILAAGGNTTIVNLNTGFDQANGVAVDGSGNLFFCNNNGVFEMTAASGYTTMKTLGSGLSGDGGVALDAAGHVFVADGGNSAVKEILAAGGYTAVKTLGSGFSGPLGVAVDVAGNVFVADFDLNEVFEILAAGGYTTTNLLGFFYGATGLAVDASGNLLITDFANYAVEELQRSLPPSVVFPTPTLLGAADTTDGAQTISVWSGGNQPLLFSAPDGGLDPSYPADFHETTASQNLCASGLILAPRASRDVSMDFVPSAVGVTAEP